jgi:hypothetical protein
VRERDGYQSEGRPTKNPRLNSKDHLSPENYVEQVEEPPKSEDDLDDYNRDRLTQGLKYIHEMSKRKITQRTQEFLKMHKTAYEAALEDDA